MSPIDPAAYSSSSLDMRRLAHYAARVARETKAQPSVGWFGSVEILHSHWPLVDWHWHRQTRSSIGGRSPLEIVETQHEYARVALLPDGLLVIAHRREDELENYGAGFTPTPDPPQQTRGPLTEQDVLSLDCSRKYFDQRTGRSRVWGDRPNAHPVRHAKGVGVNLALRDLLQRS